MKGSFGLIRFVLAAAVVLFHANALGSTAGRVAVLLFYFLSGIVMQLAITSYSGKFWRFKFITNRFLRILPNFILVSFITLFVFHAVGDLQQAFTFGDLRLVGEHVDRYDGMFEFLKLITFNIKIDAGIITGSTPVVPQGWSLVVEFLFYATLVQKSKMFYFFASPLFFIASVTIFYFAWRASDIKLWYENFLSTAIFFLIGSSLAIFLRERRDNEDYPRRDWSVQNNLVLVGYFLLLFSGPVGNSNNPRSILLQTLLFTLVGIFILSFIILHGNIENESNFVKFLGKLSYPIYISHIFCIGLLNLFGVWISTSIFNESIFLTDARGILAGNFALVSFFCTYIFSILLVLFIENPVERLRKRVKRAK